MGGSQINIIPSHLIDAAKWDYCIASGKAGKIYAKHVYLQHLADNWSGLVVNDYAAVMPVVWRKKWNIRYAYNAPFIQQLGLFGEYDTTDLRQSIDEVLKYIRYGDLYFNHANDIQPILPGAVSSVNLIIHLQTGYKAINLKYNNHLQNKLRKAAALSLQYTVSNNVALAVQTYHQLYAQRFLFIKEDNYQRLITVAKLMLPEQQCFVRQVVDKENNLLAIALFVKDENRIYNLLPSTTERGRKASAMHFLIDSVLQEFAGKPLIFDFEGSDVPGIKAFYLSFGAVNESYYHLHYNRLPVPFRWLKR